MVPSFCEHTVMAKFRAMNTISLVPRFFFFFLVVVLSSVGMNGLLFVKLYVKAETRT